jgi:hypothetical protein
MVCLVQTVHLSYTDTNTISNGLKQDSTWHMSPWSSIECVKNNFWAYGTFGANRAPILNQDLHYLQTNRNELPFKPRKLGVSSSVSKMISEPMVRLAQIVQLSCTETNTISKMIETRFYMTTSPRSSIRCIQNDFWSYGKFGANCGSILHRY